MPLRLEIEDVPYPFKLCAECKDKLGIYKIVIEPGQARSVDLFSCAEDLGLTLQKYGDSIVKLRAMMKEEKKKGLEENLGPEDIE